MLNMFRVKGSPELLRLWGVPPPIGLYKTCFHLFIKVAARGLKGRLLLLRLRGVPFGLYKICFPFFYSSCCARVNHPCVAPHTYKAHTIAILLHDNCAIYDPLKSRLLLLRLRGVPLSTPSNPE